MLQSSVRFIEGGGAAAFGRLEEVVAGPRDEDAAAVVDQRKLKRGQAG